MLELKEKVEIRIGGPAGVIACTVPKSTVHM